METKMRVKLYSPEESLISDRLVEQVTEFRNGPNEEHKGPISLELNLRNQEDIDQAIEYLKKLTGQLPLNSPKMRIAKGSVQKDNSEPLEDLIKGALQKYTKQEDLIEFLRNQNFRFVTSDIITESCKHLKDDIQLRDRDKKFQYMIRLVKEAKDPKSDKYDARLLIGIKLYGKSIPKVVVYLFGKFWKAKKMEWANSKKINHKKPEKLMKFPDFMDYDDRAKWRKEWRRLENNPELEPSKFYLKHKEFIHFY